MRIEVLSIALAPCLIAAASLHHEGRSLHESPQYTCFGPGDCVIDNAMVYRRADAESVLVDVDNAERRRLVKKSKQISGSLAKRLRWFPLPDMEPPTKGRQSTVEEDESSTDEVHGIPDVMTDDQLIKFENFYRQVLAEADADITAEVERRWIADERQARGKRQEFETEEPDVHS